MQVVNKPEPEMFKLYGRNFVVVAAFDEEENDKANQFMAANPDTGCLAIEDGRVIIASLKDMGVPA